VMLLLPFDAEHDIDILMSAGLGREEPALLRSLSLVGVVPLLPSHPPLHLFFFPLDLSESEVMGNPILSILFPCCVARRRTTSSSQEHQDESTPLLNKNRKLPQGKGETAQGQDENEQINLDKGEEGKGKQKEKKVWYDERVLRKIMVDVQR